MSNKSIKSIDFAKILKKNNYALKRVNGDHWIYYNDGYHITITHPSMNKLVALRLIKHHNLKVRAGELPGVHLYK